MLIAARKKVSHVRWGAERYVLEVSWPPGTFLTKFPPNKQICFKFLCKWSFGNWSISASVCVTKTAKGKTWKKKSNTNRKTPIHVHTWWKTCRYKGTRKQPGQENSPSPFPAIRDVLFQLLGAAGVYFEYYYELDKERRGRRSLSPPPSYQFSHAISWIYFSQHLFFFTARWHTEQRFACKHIISILVCVRPSEAHFWNSSAVDRYSLL